MSVRISAAAMVSDTTRHRADRYAHQGPAGWVVSWLPDRRLSYDQAVTAMVLAEVVATEELDCGNRMWPHLDRWAAELGLSGPDAVVRTSVGVEDVELPAGWSR